MFENDKSPTKQLDALLRAIARHVVRLNHLNAPLSEQNHDRTERANGPFVADIGSRGED
jgi:hypothetical protein